MSKRKVKKFNRRRKKQLATLMMIIIISGISAILLMTPVFNIREITVNGNSVLHTDEIVKSSGIVKNVNIFSISLNRAKDNIEKMGYIDEAKLRRRLPGKVEISVVEAVGVAYLPVNGEYMIISADGRGLDREQSVPMKVFETQHNEDGENENKEVTSGEKYFSGKLPVITGLKNVECKQGKQLSTGNKITDETVIALLKAFSASGYIFQMNEINVASNDKISFKYNNGKLNVSIGSIEKLDYKLECFGPLLAEIGEDPDGFMDLERLTYRKNQ